MGKPLTVSQKVVKEHRWKRDVEWAGEFWGCDWGQQGLYWAIQCDNRHWLVPWDDTGPVPSRSLKSSGEHSLVFTTLNSPGSALLSLANHSFKTFFVSSPTFSCPCLCPWASRLLPLSPIHVLWALLDPPFKRIQTCVHSFLSSSSDFQWHVSTKWMSCC